MHSFDTRTYIFFYVCMPKKSEKRHHTVYPGPLCGGVLWTHDHNLASGLRYSHNAHKQLNSLKISKPRKVQNI